MKEIIAFSAISISLAAFVAYEFRQSRRANDSVCPLLVYPMGGSLVFGVLAISLAISKIIEMTR